MTRDEINEVRERRLAACINMVKEAYQVDGYGVAELIGISKSTWTRYERAPWGKKGFGLFVGLSELTTVKLSWLMAEDLDPDLD
ncbi:Uncharacterised protein [Slackia heliotrinireducens]|uniref:Uncharacterized protein n=1 Tax=Slackia heliotrinireducens (strain ATCC 29202 / DSM 20476 / NCTC 11029 / RHS 1) TaxID=471855 RepID=C7N4N8_SLAHD|nr:hypothetical protein [Slackia heliotrinireducens]ACV21873.1 hypothetical protein Shel_08170 [Slackia heliotrinireducens DSM 20476]VEG99643.1 Uncharacterised protein [Slackia heliotrinireducens]